MQYKDEFESSLSILYRMGKTIILLMFSVAFIVFSVKNGRFDRWDLVNKSDEDNSFFFDQSLAAGYGSLFASIQWVVSILDYANTVFDGASGASLSSKFKLTSQLDTLWEYPLLFGAWVIPGVPGFSEVDGIPFAEQGARRFPYQWKFRITWAQYLMQSGVLDSAEKYDSISKVLLPLSSLDEDVPQYARNLAFTMLQKGGKIEQAIDVLVQTYQQVPDPLVRHQFQRKIGDLLWRNKVFLGADSSAFVGGVGSMLDADPVQAGAANALLIRMVQPETKAAALVEARHLARQFRSYQAAQLGTPQ